MDYKHLGRDSGKNRIEITHPGPHMGKTIELTDVELAELQSGNYIIVELDPIGTGNNNTAVTHAVIPKDAPLAPDGKPLASRGINPSPMVRNTDGSVAPAPAMSQEELDRLRLEPTQQRLPDDSKSQWEQDAQRPVFEPNADGSKSQEELDWERDHPMETSPVVQEPVVNEPVVVDKEVVKS